MTHWRRIDQDGQFVNHHFPGETRDVTLTPHQGKPLNPDDLFGIGNLYELDPNVFLKYFKLHYFQNTIKIM